MLFRSELCREEALSDELVAGELNWIEFAALDGPIDVKAKIRSRHREADALIAPLPGGKAHVKFAQPQTAVTPGQAVVFYRGSIVLGGGTIESASVIQP